ncbi:MAG TPA: MFS transporter, partial [Chloroflexi bacterium]|nr:MFS transporter [Chloroflexota bacterium]
MPMNNYRILTLVNFLAFIAIGINSPLLTLYLQGLGAGYALISLILTSTILVALVSNPAWGWLADRLGRRKPLYIAGLAGAALGYFWLSAASNVATAWPARLLDALSMAGVSTLGLTL